MPVAKFDDHTVWNILGWTWPLISRAVDQLEARRFATSFFNSQVFSERAEVLQIRRCQQPACTN